MIKCITCMYTITLLILIKGNKWEHKMKATGK